MLPETCHKICCPNCEMRVLLQVKFSDDVERDSSTVKKLRELPHWHCGTVKPQTDNYACPLCLHPMPQRRNRSPLSNRQFVVSFAAHIMHQFATYSGFRSRKSNTPFATKLRPDSSRSNLEPYGLGLNDNPRLHPSKRENQEVGVVILSSLIHVYGEDLRQTPPSAWLLEGLATWISDGKNSNDIHIVRDL